MRARLEGMMARYGQRVVLTKRNTGEAREVWAFVQPVRRQREELPVAATALGAVSSQRWLYIGPPGQALAPGDRVALEGLRLTAQEIQTVWWQNAPLYCRAILRREKEAAD